MTCSSATRCRKAFEQLASDKIRMRLGGIYALEGVMNDPGGQYHKPALDALCAFVRDGTIGMIVSKEGPATDIQAALAVIGRRKPGPADQIDLDKVNTPHADLVGAHFDGADLRGAHLDGAELWAAHLEGANLRFAYLEGAKGLDCAYGDAQ